MFMFPQGQDMHLFFSAIQKLQNSAKANPMDNVYYISKTNFKLVAIDCGSEVSFKITQLSLVACYSLSQI